jgi:uncharacterized protein with HEPN domain
MRRRILKLLEDMREAGRSIRAYTANRTEDQYLADKQLRRSVEREFEIIGEALRRLKTEDSALFGRISHSQRILDFRNVLAHGYDAVSDNQVWLIVTEFLPAFSAEIQGLIDDESGA